MPGKFQNKISVLGGCIIAEKEYLLTAGCYKEVWSLELGVGSLELGMGSYKKSQY